jgi:hypothetical protein
VSRKKFTEKQVLEAAAVIVEGPDGKTTVVGYLQALLTTLWHEGEGFSGKRPFGNGGWELDVYKGFVEAKLIDGELDPEHGWLNDCDSEAGKALVLEVIKRIEVR